MAIIPNFFGRERIPEVLPKSMQKIVDILKKTGSKKKCLQKAYDVISKKFEGVGIKEKIKIIFNNNTDEIWNGDGKLHCTNLNFILKVLLIKSGFFNEKDVVFKYTLIRYFSPHQYLWVRVEDDKWIKADMWAGTRGMKLGDYAHKFHY